MCSLGETAGIPLYRQVDEAWRCCYSCPVPEAFTGILTGIPENIKFLYQILRAYKRALDASMDSRVAGDCESDPSIWYVESILFLHEAIYAVVRCLNVAFYSDRVIADVPQCNFLIRLRFALAFFSDLSSAVSIPQWHRTRPPLHRKECVGVRLCV